MFRASSCLSSAATTTAVAASGLLSELGDSSAVGRGRSDRPDHDQQHCYHHVPAVNQRLLLQLLYLLMMGMRMPETYWAVCKRQAINLRSCCILLVDSVESKMMHGLATHKRISMLGLSASEDSGWRVGLSSCQAGSNPRKVWASELNYS
jgi:hypothetical protein